MSNLNILLFTQPAFGTANELNKIITSLGAKTMMWADRLLPSDMAGSEWAGDALKIYESIDRLDKDIILCDWQYNVTNRNRTNEYLLSHGFSIIPSVWNDSFTAYKTFKNAIELSNKYGDKVVGIMLTNWSLNQSQLGKILQGEVLHEDEEILLKNSINIFDYYKNK